MKHCNLNEENKEILVTSFPPNFLDFSRLRIIKLVMKKDADSGSNEIELQVTFDKAHTKEGSVCKRGNYPTRILFETYSRTLQGESMRSLKGVEMKMSER